MNLEPLNQAIEDLYQLALNNPERVFPQEIAPNTTLQADTYLSPLGNGFRVVCTIKIDENTIMTRVKNFGPDINSEHDWATSKLTHQQ